MNDVVYSDVGTYLIEELKDIPNYEIFDLTHAAKIGIFVNDATLQPGMVLSGLTEPAWSYARQNVIDEFTKFLNANTGLWNLRVGTLWKFLTTDFSGPEVSVYGWFMTTSDGTRYICGQRFDEPVLVNSEDQIIEFKIELRLPQPSVI